ncbi:MAG: hypothetical protein U0K56_09410, partial [Bacteroidaceae bacterium]|nr:hypothetical protein [Bacteroidaceae bacterium]
YHFKQFLKPVGKEHPKCMGGFHGANLTIYAEYHAPEFRIEPKKAQGGCANPDTAPLCLWFLPDYSLM